MGVWAQKVGSEALLVAFATLVVWVSAKRSATRTQGSEVFSLENHGQQSMNLLGALCLPVTASCFLVGMYVFLARAQSLVVLAASASSTFSVAFAVAPLLEAFCPFPEVLSFLIGVVAVAYWLSTGSWISLNILGVCACVACVSAVRLPDLKIACVSLSSLFFYDIFWVFFSSSIFQDNVMVAVANAPAKNPTPLGPDYLPLPIKFLLPLGCPGFFRLLGLGDIAIPGLLVALAKRFDNFLANMEKNNHHDDLDDKTLNSSSSSSAEDRLALQHSSSHSFRRRREVAIPQEEEEEDDDDDSVRPPRKTPSYATVAMIAYATGLAAACAAADLFDSPQPALLYLVPAVLGSVVARAYMNDSHLTLLWNGFDDDDEDEDLDLESGATPAPTEDDQKKKTRDAPAATTITSFFPFSGHATTI